ncbi:MAG: radical SAM protein [Spirochaetes bacterium]|nr:radical SAM protein [Spirochaetota bacterium]
MINIWNEFEYSKFKLLLNHEKVKSIFNVLEKRSAYDSLPPISVEFHLTDICNLRCSWCTDRGLREHKASLDKDVACRAFDYFARNGVGVTIEGGGEPSVHKDFVSVIKYGNDIKLHMGLITNGVNDISEVIGFFKWARISLDSSNALEYTEEKGLDRFEQVISNLTRFANARNPRKTHLGVGYVLTKRNIATVMDILPKLDNINVDYVYLRPVEEAVNLMPSIDELFALKKKLLSFMDTSRIKCLLSISDRLIKNNDGLPCVAHSLTCIVQANGDVALCEKRRHDLIMLGNINDASFERIWNSDVRIAASRKLIDPTSQQGCDVCRITSFNRVLNDVSSIHTKNFI